MEPILRFGSSSFFSRQLVHVDAKWLNQFAVLHIAGAGRFACAAVQAKFQVMASLGAHLHPAIGNSPHQIDPATRTVVFIRSFDVRRARRGTKAAVYAVQKQLVVDACPWVRLGGTRNGRQRRRVRRGVCGGFCRGSAAHIGNTVRVSEELQWKKGDADGETSPLVKDESATIEDVFRVELSLHRVH